MKNITLSADERDIEAARERARAQRTTLNALFRDWLKQLARPASDASHYAELMARLEHVSPGRKFSREELNER